MLRSFAVLILGSQLLTASQPAAFRERAKPYLDSALAAGQQFVVLSAASAMPNVSPDSLVTLLGSYLASVTAAGTAPYPKSLGAIILQIQDSAGAIHQPPLLYVSPDQINFLLPAAAATGTAIITIINAAGSPLSAKFEIQPVAPALFTANENAQGVVSATAYHTVLPTTLAVPIPVYQCLDTPDSCQSVPLPLGIDTPVFVTLNATGLRGRSSDSAVRLTIAGQQIRIQAINALDDDSSRAGIDQIFFPVPLTLRGAGEVDLSIGVDTATSNTARINIQ